MKKTPEWAPDPDNGDAEKIEIIRKLIEEDGWKLRGNMFQKDQRYELTLYKDGEEDKKFYTTRPYPKVIDASGNTVETL